MEAPSGAESHVRWLACSSASAYPEGKSVSDKSVLGPCEPCRFWTNTGHRPPACLAVSVAIDPDRTWRGWNPAVRGLLAHRGVTGIDHVAPNWCSEHDRQGGASASCSPMRPVPRTVASSSSRSDTLVRLETPKRVAVESLKHFRWHHHKSQPWLCRQLACGSCEFLHLLT